jgi:hypothetical protein
MFTERAVFGGTLGRGVGRKSIPPAFGVVYGPLRGLSEGFRGGGPAAGSGRPMDDMSIWTDYILHL